MSKVGVGLARNGRSMCAEGLLRGDLSVKLFKR